MPPKKYEYDKKTTRQGTIVKNFKSGRNNDCPCGSGKKYKKCCDK